MAIFDEENKNLISSCKFFQILGQQTLDGSGIRIRDPDPESGSVIRKNAGSGSVSGSALNQCGSETLPATNWLGGTKKGTLMEKMTIIDKKSSHCADRPPRI
jgi:hypothetical protein